MLRVMRGTISNDYNRLIINNLHPWNNFELKTEAKNRVTRIWRTPQPRNCLTSWRYKAPTKGCRGYEVPDLQTVGVRP